ncbi:MAG: tryptophan--tRNA ligase [Clostridiales bacterium]|nr:tryptophan--tRNA ligase [Clostridiales bacterium]
MSETNQSKKPVLYSGIQPSGVIHIGNYIGAVSNFIKLERDYTCLFGIADLHALTVRQDPAALRRQTQQLAALYIACGLDPGKNIIYCQSHVPAHAELSWVLNCYTYMGELSRMTQYKDKSARHKDNVNAGLFTYPVLMAADILLYQAQVVPVGTDQKQHLEITRDIAERFNAVYGDVFVIPEPYIPKETAKIMSLTDPERKMSKSDDAESFVSLLDDEATIRRKFRRAVTDSDAAIRMDPEQKPGVSNLLTILSVMSGRCIEVLCDEFEGKGYGVLKDAVADAVIGVLTPIQQRYHELIADKAYVASVLKAGADKASALAERTLRKVYRKVGLYQA